MAKLENGDHLDASKNEVIRQVYSDIEGLNIEGVLPAPDDWRDVPDDSVIFYDEVHYRKEYEDLTGKPSQNPMIKDLTTHGHRNIDIYLITQAASRIERSIRGLVDCISYYAKRPQQKPPFVLFMNLISSIMSLPMLLKKAKNTINTFFNLKTNTKTLINLRPHTPV